MDVHKGARGGFNSASHGPQYYGSISKKVNYSRAHKVTLQTCPSFYTHSANNWANPAPQPLTPCCSPSPSHQSVTSDPTQQPGDGPVSHQELSTDLTSICLPRQRDRSHDSSRSIFLQRTSRSLKIRLILPISFPRVHPLSAAQAMLIEQMRCGWVIISLF